MFFLSWDHHSMYLTSLICFVGGIHTQVACLFFVIRAMSDWTTMRQLGLTNKQVLLANHAIISQSWDTIEVWADFLMGFHHQMITENTNQQKTTDRLNYYVRTESSPNTVVKNVLLFLTFQQHDLHDAGVPSTINDNVLNPMANCQPNILLSEGFWPPKPMTEALGDVRTCTLHDDAQI